MGKYLENAIPVTALMKEKLVDKAGFIVAKSLMPGEVILSSCPQFHIFPEFYGCTKVWNPAPTWGTLNRIKLYFTTLIKAALTGTK